MQNEWISVKDRLPENNCKCLIWTEIYFTPDHIDEPNHYDGFEISSFYKEHGFISKSGLFAKYWQPLPEPPKGE
jgi:hypothetical protein